MERVYGEKSVAELRILNMTISVFIKSEHEQLNLLLLIIHTYFRQNSLECLPRRSTRALRVKHPKRINKVKVGFKRQLDFNPFHMLFQIQLFHQHVENILFRF